VLTVGTETAGANALTGTVAAIQYLGNSTDYEVKLASGDSVSVRSENHKDGTMVAAIGEQVVVTIDPKALRVLPE